MALKKLPRDIQSLMSASAQINTFKKAVEELVYNALDAESTSIAIRLHIGASVIQVIDNGYGIQKHDSKALGQKHMTSKITDLATLRSVPKTYGHRGESLADIIVVSRSVRITSRHKDDVEDTWVKTFRNGKEEGIAEMSKRPSKGTTVEVKGFLYNLVIQKKTVDSMNELQKIKLFLEHISLVHHSISLSLRDDSKNEIVFKIHKKRDIYQTLSSLFNIKVDEIQELQVEKSNYRVRGLIGKTEKECNLYWIYINGRFILNNSNLHRIVDDHFKALTLKNKLQKYTKSKNHTDENYLFNKNIPCYCIFITCPYIDYSTFDAPKPSVIEFKNWEPITKLLQKLVKFYAGDLNVKEMKPPNQIAPNNEESNATTKKDTRDNVKKIIDKILGNHSKKFGVSQLQRGIKGKLIKRNAQRKLKDQTLSKLSKVPVKEDDRAIVDNENVPRNKCSKGVHIKSKHMKPKSDPKENIVRKKKTKKKSPYISKAVKDKEFHSISNLNKHIPKEIPIRNRTRNLITTKKSHYKASKDNANGYKKVTQNIFSKFEKDFHSVEKRSKRIAEKLLYHNIMNTKHRVKSPKINPSLNNDIVPLPPKLNRNVIDKYIWIKMREKTFKTTYDLVQTILRSQQELSAEKENNGDVNTPYRYHNNCDSKLPSNRSSSVGVESKLTFESHCHYRNQGLHTEIDPKYILNPDNNARFITTQSRDNFIVPKENFKCKLRNQLKTRRKVYDRTRMYDVYLEQTIEESMYPIEFSKTGPNIKDHASRINSPINKPDTYESMKYMQKKYYSSKNAPDYEHFIPIGNTYSLSPSDLSYKCRTSAQNTNCEGTNKRNVTLTSEPINNIEDTFDCIEHNDYGIYHSEIKDRDTVNNEKHLNIIFVSESQSPNVEFTDVCNLDPIDMCETMLDNPDINVNELRNICNPNTKHNDILFQNVTNTQEISIHRAPAITVIENDNYLDQNAVENYKDTDNENNLQIVGEHYAKDVPNQIDKNNELDDNMAANNNFDFKDRLRFLPKGMSQIFALCNSKTACNYNLDQDYFEDSIYYNFVNDVQVNVETYEPVIQNVKDYTTANIQKVNDKLNKANADLVFDGISLKEAKVLGQIDCKFIAAIMRHKSYQSEEPKEHLVLFDQHAVHERIRLEKNIADYLSNDQWKSVSLDNIALNLSKDEIIYLHNYEDKLKQLGLQYTILGDSEVLVNAIPEAILGKNLREVENIIKAVKNLIKEEINIIKMQRGCVSLYPKSIMELVFSEACRYAIKFGDRLSMTDCKDLLHALSKCKTPFQCAHGRPVMAVIMDVKTANPEYKVDIQKIKHYALKRKAV